MWTLIDYYEALALDLAESGDWAGLRQVVRVVTLIRNRQATTLDRENWQARLEAVIAYLPESEREVEAA